jgi:regulator of protease activity HflC (stomatin/prohibitin superfamily)
MESAFAWIGKIADWIGQWIPRRSILDTTEGAIKYTGFFLPRRLRVALGGFDGEIEVKVCKAGIHWYWPAASTWVVYPTAKQTDRLETQTMESKDGKTFLVGGTLTYQVTDLALLVPQNHSPVTATIDIAMLAIHDVCCSLDWTELQEEQRKGTLKTKLKNAAQRDLEDIGIKVIRLKLNSLARCRVLKISQSTSSEEN